MAYAPKDWSNGDAVTAAEMDRMERGIMSPCDDVTSGAVMTGAPNRGGNLWVYTTPGQVTFYPVLYTDPFGVNGSGMHLRANPAVGSVFHMGLYNTQASLFKPGALVASTSFASDTPGWKFANYTAVTGLPAGWYWHAQLTVASAGCDIHSTGPLAVDVFARGALADEWGTRIDNKQNSWATVSTSLTSLPTLDPVINTWDKFPPYVSMRFV